jgi:uncharacterized membrane protein YkoI
MMKITKKTGKIAIAILSAVALTAALAVGVHAADKYIGKDAATDIALDHAELTTEDVLYSRTRLERDDGRIEYDVEFYCDGVEYDYEIDATTGEILSFDKDAEHIVRRSQTTTSKKAAVTTAKPKTTTKTPTTTAAKDSEFITETEAENIALEKIGLTRDDITRIYTEFDRDDWHYEYEVEIRVGWEEYTVTIDAETGKILEYDYDND